MGMLCNKDADVENWFLNVTESNRKVVEGGGGPGENKITRTSSS